MHEEEADADAEGEADSEAEARPHTSALLKVGEGGARRRNTGPTRGMQEEGTGAAAAAAEAEAEAEPEVWQHTRPLLKVAVGDVRIRSTRPTQGTQEGAGAEAEGEGEGEGEAEAWQHTRPSNSLLLSGSRSFQERSLLERTVQATGSQEESPFQLRSPVKSCLVLADAGVAGGRGRLKKQVSFSRVVHVRRFQSCDASIGGQG
ncbi:hypothetical protein CLOM_g14063 [Closterium sp. NIES-68]|nr:hypothetical protein CLOM_g14063 [Closterium sp. NIES-68]